MVGPSTVARAAAAATSSVKAAVRSYDDDDYDDDNQVLVIESDESFVRAPCAFERLPDRKQASISSRTNIRP